MSSTTMQVARQVICTSGSPFCCENQIPGQPSKPVHASLATPPCFNSSSRLKLCLQQNIPRAQRSNPAHSLPTLTTTQSFSPLSVSSIPHTTNSSQKHST